MVGIWPGKKFRAESNQEQEFSPAATGRSQEIEGQPRGQAGDTRHSRIPTQIYQLLKGQRGRIWRLVELLLGEAGLECPTMGQCRAAGSQTGEDPRSFLHSDLWGEERQRRR